jgi:EAL domain-containing protein (putative c-di-GMP-specific phosphodiesterase class I)
MQQTEWPMDVLPQYDNEIFAPLLERMLDGSLPFVLHFQPIVDLRRALVVGYEVLARFPVEIGLAPEACFQMADLCGRRLDLEEALLHRALGVRETIPHNCFLTINLSPTLMLSSRWDALLEDIRALDPVGGLDGIIIEITEQDSIADYDCMRQKIEEIRNLRGSIAVDDTGSGFASLKHVMELKPNFVKLDRFFVGNCHADRSKTTLIQMIGMATDRLDAWVIAEGVETSEELDELIRLDVPLGQGYFLGRPEPEMLPLDPAIAASIHTRIQALGHSETMLGYVEPCPTFASRSEAELYLDQNPQTDLAVVLDEWRRPFELLERHPLAGLRTVDRFMRVQLATEPGEVLHRALTRGNAQHFDPFAVIDEQGEFRGVIRVERLMRGVLEARPSDTI